MNEPELRILRTALRVLRMIREDTRAISNQQEGREQQQNIQPIWLNPILAAHRQSEANRTANEDRQYRVQNSLRWASWLAVIAAVIYAGITHRTLQETKRQANTTQNQLAASIESFRTDERAWLEIEPGPSVRERPADKIFGASFKYELFLKNVGKTAAYEISSRALRNPILAVLDFGDHADYVQRAQTRLTEPNQFPGTTPQEEIVLLSKRVPNTLGPGIKSIAPLELFGAEPRNNGYNFLIGRVDYTDAFSVKHWLTFCFYVETGGDLRYCQYGNDKDRNLEIPPAPKR